MKNLNEIYQSYADEVKRFLICLSSDIDLAEELTQETFYQAVKSIHRYDGTCKMSVWLCQIAKHMFYNHLKREKKQNTASIEEMLQSGLDLKDNADRMDQKMEKRDTYLSIHKQIHHLEEPYRELFMLRTSTELSFREIGEIFNKTENWARVTFYQAGVKLAERIQSESYEV